MVLRFTVFCDRTRSFDVCCGHGLQFVINPSLLLSSCQASDGVFDVVDWDMWFYGTGMPTYTPQ